MNLEFQYLVDYLAISLLILGSALYMARRLLLAIFPALSSRGEQSLVLDRGEQSSCSGCGIADRNRKG